MNNQVISIRQWVVGHIVGIEYTGFVVEHIGIEWQVGHKSLVGCITLGNKQVGRFKSKGDIRWWVRHMIKEHIEWVEHIMRIRRIKQWINKSMEHIEFKVAHTKWWVGHNWCNWFSQG